MEYKWIGWMQEGNSDKVWGVIQLIEAIHPVDSWKTGTLPSQGKYCTFWGRRGKKLQTKIVEGSNYEINKMICKKTEKGYEGVDMARLNEVYPEFEADLKKTAFWASFKV